MAVCLADHLTGGIVGIGHHHIAPSVGHALDLGALDRSFGRARLPLVGGGQTTPPRITGADESTVGVVAVVDGTPEIVGDRRHTLVLRVTSTCSPAERHPFAVRRDHPGNIRKVFADAGGRPLDGHGIAEPVSDRAQLTLVGTELVRGTVEQRQRPGVVGAVETAQIVDRERRPGPRRRCGGRLVRARSGGAGRAVGIVDNFGPVRLDQIDWARLKAARDRSEVDEVGVVVRHPDTEVSRGGVVLAVGASQADRQTSFKERSVLDEMKRPVLRSTGSPAVGIIIVVRRRYGGRTGST